MLNRKLKGGALYIALIISIVIGVILSVFILIAYFNQKLTISHLALNQLRWNVESGFQISQSGSFNISDNCVWEQNSFNEDSVRIKNLQWGAYQLVVCESKNRRQYYKKEGLFGAASFHDTALIVTDVGRPISLAGKIKFNGGCYLPKATYKAAYIEGFSFTTESNLNMFIHAAPSEIPGLNEIFEKRMAENFEELNNKTDSLVTDISNIINSFSAKTVVFQTPTLVLDGQQLSGNVKLIINNKVIIEKNAKLDNIFIIAKKVLIKKEFTGSLHILASDSIVVEESCFLKYPSSLTVLNKNTEEQINLSGVFLGAKCIVQGAILAYVTNNKNKAMISLNSDNEVYGLVYSSGYTGLQGKIFGTVVSEKLLLKTPSAVYENHILNTELDSKKYANSMIIPAAFGKQKSDKCVKWL